MQLASVIIFAVVGLTCAADPTPILTVKASATCQDFYEPCIQACGHLVKHAECYYSQGNSGPLCARCICNDGSDKTSSMPMHCSSSTCNYPSGQGGCPKQGESKSPPIVVATDPTPIVTVKDHECKERGSGYLPPQQASSLNSVAKWAESACGSHTFSWSEVNWDKGGAFCCKARDDPGHANPTWNIYQLADSKLESSTSATCQDFYEPCIQACGHLVKHAECYYSQGNSGPLCARCICNDGSDKTSSMPMHCSSSTCNYPSGQGGCPKQSPSSNNTSSLAEVIV